MKTRTIRQADRPTERRDGRARKPRAEASTIIENRAAAPVGTLEMVIGVCEKTGYEVFCTDWFMPTDEHDAPASGQN